MDPPPNPLFVRIAQEVLKRKLDASDDEGKLELAEGLDPTADRVVANFKAHARASVEARANARKQVVETVDNVLQKAPGDVDAEMANRILATAARAEVQIPELVLLAGYLGEEVEVLGKPWRILYVDAQLQNWRFIPKADILLHRSINDRTAAFGKRDLLWIMGDALTAEGGAPPRPKAQADFLAGPFTRAAALTQPIVDEDASPATGVFCQAITPRCCTRGVRPR